MLHEIPKITQPKKTKMYSKLRRLQLELRSEKLPQTIFANRLWFPKSIQFMMKNTKTINRYETLT